MILRWRENQIDLAFPEDVVAKQASLGGLPERSQVSPESLGWKHFAQHGSRYRIRAFAAVCANVNTRIGAHELRSSPEDGPQERSVFLSVFKLSSMFSRYPRRVRPPAQEPQSQPLIIMVVRHTIVRRRCKQ